MADVRHSVMHAEEDQSGRLLNHCIENGHSEVSPAAYLRERERERETERGINKCHWLIEWFAGCFFLFSWMARNSVFEICGSYARYETLLYCGCTWNMGFEKECQRFNLGICMTSALFVIIVCLCGYVVSSKREGRKGVLLLYMGAACLSTKVE